MTTITLKVDRGVRERDIAVVAVLVPVKSQEGQIGQINADWIGDDCTGCAVLYTCLPVTETDADCIHAVTRANGVSETEHR